MKRSFLSEDVAATVGGLLLVFGGLLAFTVFGYSPVAGKFSWDSGAALLGLLSWSNLGSILLSLVIAFMLFLFEQAVQGRSWRSAAGFPVIFLLATLASFIGGNKTVNHWGLETVIFSLLIGLLLNNTVGTAGWLRRSLSSELYIKTGLIFLGATILFQNLLTMGWWGLVQSVIVVFGVWYFSFWLCRRTGIDGEMSVMMSSAVSICGVSAAIASAGAIKGDPKKLSYVVSLVLIVAVPMIIIMPFLARLLSLEPAVAGAWIGGTIDTTGAVVATGTLYGDKALEVATIVKFSQNVLLGIAAFLIAIYWNVSRHASDAAVARPGLRVIWERFPKFVLGFIFVSLLFSVFFAGSEYKPVTGAMKQFQNLWFTMGFVSIGLETDFKALLNRGNRKAGWVFLGAQGFNVIFTLVVAYIIFGLLQPHIANS
ncbi:MAG: YeiH family protein [Bacteroidales bacterium]|jgi:uncharacterized integral membrane protein (TIGR00698 family)|nr:YeiH family protein [Bacteroidales bacterium]